MFPEAVTFPVNDGLAKFDLRFSAVCWAVDTGLFASDVFVTLLYVVFAVLSPVFVPDWFCSLASAIIEPFHVPLPIVPTIVILPLPAIGE